MSSRATGGKFDDRLIVVMRCLLLAFSLGIVMLQRQASLPPSWRAVYALLPFLLAMGCVVYS
ncbi:MAG TPA: hypothetical protein VIM74_04450, partial [Casimicrobiaceae bacterium]